MSRVVLIERPDTLDAATEQDMRRWWRHRCKKHVIGNEVFFEVTPPMHLNVYEAITRLASFGVPARAANRPV